MPVKTETSGSRKIRSFVRREGRITPAQQRALRELWPQFGLEPRDLAKGPDIFSLPAPLNLEIGFGNGESLAHMATALPEQNFIGIEVHRPGVGNLLQVLEQRNLPNVRLVCADAVEVINNYLPDQSLDRVFLFFPDPWHKKRHHKRRIVNLSFADLLARKLKIGGIFHLATDWQDYAENMLAVLDPHTAFRNLAGSGHYSQCPEYRPVTKFERRGTKLGHGVWDLLYQRR